MSQSQKSKAKAKFDYREKLLTKGITTDTLLKKLKVRPHACIHPRSFGRDADIVSLVTPAQALHEELSQEDKDYEDKSVLDGYRTELIHRSILFHKECVHDACALVRCSLPFVLITGLFSFPLSLSFLFLSSISLPSFCAYFKALASRPTQPVASPTSSGTTPPTRPTTRRDSRYRLPPTIC